MKGPAEELIVSSWVFNIVYICAGSVIAYINFWNVDDIAENIIMQALAAFDLYVDKSLEYCAWSSSPRGSICILARDEDSRSCGCGSTSAFSIPWTMF